MPLSANSMPFTPPRQIAPFDIATAFGTNGAAETKTATGYFGAPTQLDVGFGLVMRGRWAIDITAVDFASADESYTFYLLGSNDVNWANGNVEILQAQNYGAARSIATIIGATPAMPTVGNAGVLDVFPFVNMKWNIVYRYLRAYVVIAGTTPSITANTWLAYDC